MHTSLGLRLTTLATLALSALSVSKPALAVTFNNQEVDQSKVIAVAAPYGTNAYQLLVLEQIANSRACWNENGASPTAVEPLLLNFDFTGICSRSTDSNGYSVRVAGEDLGWRYSLRLVKQQNDLVLLAISNTDRKAPAIEVGRTNGVPKNFGKIMLNPGWRLTKRVYNGRLQGHTYLTNDQSLANLIATASTSSSDTPTQFVIPPKTTQPVTLPSTVVARPPAVVVPTSPSATSPSGVILTSPPKPPSVVIPTSPSTASPSVVIPTLPPPSTAIPITPGNTPASLPASGSVLPPIRVNPSPSGSQPPSFQTIGSNYRVIVPARTAAIQNRVKALVPGAFRTTFNGQVVMQAGVFREQNKANEIQQLLIGNQLQALVVPINAGGLSQNQPPITNTKPIPKGRAVIVIDPGHGGRDPGALGIGGLQEKQVVFAISRQVVSLLEQQGIQALLTRQDDREIDLEPRVQIAERANANVFVSIHANSINLSRPDINGLETYYYSDEGRRLAQTIHSSLLQDSSIPDRGVRKANFYVIKQTPMPATLVEVGFVTGREDAARLANPASQTRIAQAIARGIMQYVRANFG